MWVMVRATGKLKLDGGTEKDGRTSVENNMMLSHKIVSLLDICLRKGKHVHTDV